jgi:hypothetical protein
MEAWKIRLQQRRHRRRVKKRLDAGRRAGPSHSAIDDISISQVLSYYKAEYLISRLVFSMSDSIENKMIKGPTRTHISGGERVSDRTLDGKKTQNIIS